METYFANIHNADFESELFERYDKLFDVDDDQRPPIFHVFDRHGVLKPYYGTWVGMYGEHLYEFYIYPIRRVKQELLIDQISVAFKVYKRASTQGELELVEYSSMLFRGEAIESMFMTWYSPTYCSVFYTGADDKHYGSVYLHPKGDKQLQMYLMDEGHLKGYPQVFPVWDGRLGKGETTLMYKVSDDCPSGWNVLDGRRESNDDLYRDLQKFLLLSRLYGRGKLQVDYTDVALCEMILATHLYRGDYDEGKPFIKNGDERFIATDDVYKFVFGSTYTNASSIQRQAYWYKLLRQMAMFEGMLKSKSVDERRSERVELVEVLGKEPLATLRGYAQHKGLNFDEVLRYYFQDAINLARDSRMCDPDKFAEALAEDLFDAPMSYAELKRRVKL